MSTNVNTSPFGFRPLATNLQGAPGRIKQYAQPASDSHQIFKWDMVTLVAGSSVAQEGYPALNLQNIKSYSQGTPGTTPLLGSVANGNSAASTLGYLMVYDDPFQLFVAMLANDGPTVFSVATYGADNANVKNTAAATGALFSAMSIEDTSLNTTNTLDLHINGGLSQPPNVESNYAILEVTINRHQLQNQVAGV
jgi:hypothetical protein